MISLLSHLPLRNDIHKNIFSSSKKTGASITSAVDDVTWPMPEWNIPVNSSKMGLLYLSNTVFYQYRRSITFICKHTQKKYTHLPAILYARRCSDIPHLSAKHTFPHTAQHAYTSSHDGMWINNPIKYDWGFFQLKAFTLALCVSLRMRYAQEVPTDKQFTGQTHAHTEQSTRRHG